MYEKHLHIEINLKVETVELCTFFFLFYPQKKKILCKQINTNINRRRRRREEKKWKTHSHSWTMHKFLYTNLYSYMHGYKNWVLGQLHKKRRRRKIAMSIKLMQIHLYECIPWNSYVSFNMSLTIVIPAFLLDYLLKRAKIKHCQIWIKYWHKRHNYVWFNRIIIQNLWHQCKGFQ